VVSRRTTTSDKHVRVVELTEAEQAAFDEAIADADRTKESELVTTSAVLAMLDKMLDKSR
jgi:DNA-binding MarR family transcriptional regulator